jgi:hypothetical protein
MVERRPYPSTVHATDFQAMRALLPSIRSAHLVRSDGPGGISAHTFWLFVTNEGRVIMCRGGAENEPREAHFASVIPGAFGQRTIGIPSLASTPDFGRLIPTMSELATVLARTDPRRSAAEDATTTTLDTCNFLEVVQGLGIRGLRTRSNVHITEVETDPGRAQRLFAAALEVTELLHNAQFAYSLLPQGNGRTGINSHTMATLIAECADSMAITAGEQPRYVRAFAGQPGLYPGSSTASLFAGPDLNTVSRLAHPDYNLSLAHGRWNPVSGRTPIPRAHLMPYAQGVLPPQAHLETDASLALAEATATTDHRRFGTVIPAAWDTDALPLPDIRHVPHGGGAIHHTGTYRAIQRDHRPRVVRPVAHTPRVTPTSQCPLARLVSTRQPEWAQEVLYRPSF